MVPPPSNLNSNQVEICALKAISKNYSYTKIIKLFLEMMSQRHHFLFYATSLFLVLCCSNFLQRCILVLQTKVPNVVEIGKE